MKPFGYSLHLDCYGVSAERCDSMELCYTFLDTLVEKLGMTKFGLPIIVHGPRQNGAELFPEKSGLSGVQFLIESSITIHTIVPKEFVTIDCYSCKEFDPKIVIDYVKWIYKPLDYEDSFLARGLRYE
jgi:S-adenosylmethionine/arginine decarboxylase-like enzyme